MKNMSAWAIRHPVTPVVLFVVLVFMGLVAFFRLPRTLNPDISFPGVQVLVSQPGASPQEIETQIMQKVEAAVASIGNIDSITSLAIEGQSRVFIEFAIGTPDRSRGRRRTRCSLQGARRPARRASRSRSWRAWTPTPTTSPPMRSAAVRSRTRTCPGSSTTP